MSKKKLKKAKWSDFCSACGSEAGHLLRTVPGTLRPRTETEADVLERKKEFKTLTPEDMHQDRISRRVRLCPKCIKLGHEMLEGKAPKDKELVKKMKRFEK